ncbi:MAG: hypothetical protein PGN22_15785 [Agrobacterium cavarae]
MTDLIHELGFYSAKKKWPLGLDGMPDLLKRAAAAVAEAEARVKDARRQALEDAAKTIEEGFDRGIASKHDLCAHKKFEWEDCETCAAKAVRALIPEEERAKDTSSPFTIVAAWHDKQAATFREMAQDVRSGELGRAKAAAAAKHHAGSAAAMRLVAITERQRAVSQMKGASE